MPAAPQTAPLSRRIPVLTIILLSYFMTVLDVTIVISGLPKIHQSLGFSATLLSWVQNACTLAFGGLLLLGARAGDILGRRRMFAAGTAMLALALAVMVMRAIRPRRAADSSLRVTTYSGPRAVNRTQKSTG